MALIARRFWFYLLSLALNIFLVLFIFRTIAPKNKAAIFAGSLFVVISLLIMGGEYFYGRRWRSWSFLAAFMFLIVFSVPMLAVRALNYDVEFSALEVWGMSAPLFHGASNIGYLLLVFGVVIDAWNNRNKK